MLHLLLIDDIAAAAIAMSLCQKTQDMYLHDIYKMSAVDIMAAFGLSPIQAQKITTGLTDTKLLENELMLIEKYNIQWATILCSSYPTLLKNIHMPPPIIYWQGAAPAHEKTIAFVGSRKANSYGQMVIESLVPPLVNYGYTIVSGGALGADSMAHRATLQANGKTIVVLGSGLLRPYPAAHKKLFEDVITTGGTLLSTFSLQTEPFPYNFPARNRIISGLSRGTIVVQAAARSGTSITAHFALEQGRDVFAVPGSIYDELSAGCHNLIAQGAKLTTHAYDVLREFGENVPEPEEKTTSKKSKSTQAATKSQVPIFKPATPEIQDSSPTGLILQQCQAPCSTDDLAEKTGIDLANLNALLFDLRLEGKINQNFMGMWLVRQTPTGRAHDDMEVFTE